MVAILIAAAAVVPSALSDAAGSVADPAELVGSCDNLLGRNPDGTADHGAGDCGGAPANC
jgi:hypothetical protein